MARRKRPHGVRTTQTKPINTPASELPPIPDEEIDAEVEATETRIAEEDAALAEMEAERGVETIPANDPPSTSDLMRGMHEEADDSGPTIAEELYEGNPLLDEEPEPPFDPEIFERGPLAAGIRMLEALLTEARGGYITAQVEELERVLDEQFTDPERFFLGNVAAQERTASGLPDVAGAYKALVRARSAAQA